MADYGRELKSAIVKEDKSRPVKISVIEQHDRVWLDIRYMYHNKDGELQYTSKGIRLETDDGTAEEALAAAQALGEEYFVW